jgi:DivIVA domain-containing protein
VWVLWLVVVASLMVVVVLLALGRGSGPAPVEPDEIVVDLPEDRVMLPSDIDELRLPLALRGYQMAAVDDVLDRVAAELALRDAQIRELQAMKERGSR